MSDERKECNTYKGRHFKHTPWLQSTYTRTRKGASTNLSTVIWYTIGLREKRGGVRVGNCCIATVATLQGGYEKGNRCVWGACASDPKHLVVAWLTTPLVSVHRQLTVPSGKVYELC